MKISSFKSAISALFLSLVLVFAAVTAGMSADVKFPRGQVRIVTPSGASHIFAVEIAATMEARTQGLMNRTDLGPNQGMFFDFGQTRLVTMWMRNTPLPLDMIFITEDGTVTHIAENTTPFSDAIIESRGPVRFVLEVNAGRSRALGISPGAKITVAEAK
ncbi:DUF192 domain-containing protein [Rhizobium sp. RU36D]|uniref:DUF192 domain-containing protein n=1 Tax=Rhizobium sp. RU36D TaxID=1907415 RepID=UPI0009D84D40|nr:DUF192 domain-containing protein [Rhizobium sp. RU36D]SMC66856.1 hypothetical protein SAMN05880593_104110 [Rhizobium sp. RU36D]